MAADSTGAAGEAPTRPLQRSASDVQCAVERPSERLGTWLWAVWVLQARVSRSALVDPSFYLAVAVALAAAGLLLHNSVRFAESAGVLVSARPLFLPQLVTCFLMAVYLGLSAAVTLAREQERGTLEVLLYGPANESALAAGIFVALCKLYILAAAASLLWSAVAALTLHFLLTPDSLWLLAATFLATGASIAFGLLAAALGRRTRSAVVLFLLATGLLLAVQAGDQLVGLLMSATSNGSEALFVIRNALAGLASVTVWISPFALLLRSADMLQEGDRQGYWMALAGMAVQSVVLLSACGFLLHRQRGSKQP